MSKQYLTKREEALFKELDMRKELNREILFIFYEGFFYYKTEVPKEDLLKDFPNLKNNMFEVKRINEDGIQEFSVLKLTPEQYGGFVCKILPCVPYRISAINSNAMTNEEFRMFMDNKSED